MYCESDLGMPGRGSALGILQLECWQQSEGGWYWVYIDHILHLHCWGCGKDAIACCGGNPWTKWWTEEVRVNLKLKKNFYWAHYTVGSWRLPADQENAARAVTEAKTSWKQTFSLFWSNSGERVVQEGKAEPYLHSVQWEWVLLTWTHDVVRHCKEYFKHVNPLTQLL